MGTLNRQLILMTDARAGFSGPRPVVATAMHDVILVLVRRIPVSGDR